MTIEELLKELEAQAGNTLPDDCVYDEGFDDFLHNINDEYKKGEDKNVN